MSGSKEVIVWCGHDLSLLGAEGPGLVRLPVLWTCDECGAAVISL